MVGTGEMLRSLRKRGYRITYGYLQSLLDSTAVESPPIFAGRRVWSPDDIAALERVLRDRGRLADGDQNGR